MPLSVLTGKWQTTIPKAIRNFLGLKPNDKILYLIKDEVQDKVEKILNTPNLLCPHKDLILSALTLYSEKNLDFIDA